MGNSKSYHHELVVREMPHNVRQLHFAVKSNDRETVNNLVARGVNINFPFLCATNPSIKDGNTPLIIAVSLNHTELVEVLLRAGAYINKCDKNGCTPVYKAAFHGRSTLIELLAKAGADVNLADFQGKTPLYICVNNAVVHACRSAIIKLLAAGALVDKCDVMGQAPIHIAAHWKLVDVLAVLVAARSDVNICDARGRTPLYICVRSLTTKLYVEDLRLRMPCIVTLYRARADMLNLVEWILYKGSGIPVELLEPWPDFAVWYRSQLHCPMSLANACRKVVQMQLCLCGKSKLAAADASSYNGCCNDKNHNSFNGQFSSYNNDNFSCFSTPNSANTAAITHHHQHHQHCLYYYYQHYNNGTNHQYIHPHSPPQTNHNHSRASQSITRCFPSNVTSNYPVWRSNNVTSAYFSNSSSFCTCGDDRWRQEGLVAAVRKLPVPAKIKIFLSRKMFYNETNPDLTSPCNATPSTFPTGGQDVNDSNVENIRPRINPSVVAEVVTSPAAASDSVALIRTSLLSRLDISSGNISSHIAGGSNNNNNNNNNNDDNNNNINNDNSLAVGS